MPISVPCTRRTPRSRRSGRPDGKLWAKQVIFPQKLKNQNDDENRLFLSSKQLAMGRWRRVIRLASWF